VHAACKNRKNVAVTLHPGFPTRNTGARETPWFRSGMPFAQGRRMHALRALLLVLPLATAAVAHGGSFGHARVQRGIPCDCGRIECDLCATRDVRDPDAYTCREDVTELKRWGDVARCRVTVTIEAARDHGVEAYASLEPAPVFAAVTGTLWNAGALMAAALRPSEEVRRSYLYERRLATADPMLVLRRGPGRIDVRVYPVTREEPAVATVEGYILVADAGPLSAVRAYATGDRCLVVTDPAAAQLPQWSDDARALHFLSREEAGVRFPGAALQEVPFVAALETAVTGLGDAAAAEERTLAALPAGSRQPPFIGPDRQLSGVPPGLREPEDPAPPPPPDAQKPKSART